MSDSKQAIILSYSQNWELNVNNSYKFVTKEISIRTQTHSIVSNSELINAQCKFQNCK